MNTDIVLVTKMKPYTTDSNQKLADLLETIGVPIVTYNNVDIFYDYKDVPDDLHKYIEYTIDFSDGSRLIPVYVGDNP